MREAWLLAIALCMLLTGCASAQAVQPRERVVLDAREASYEPPEAISGDLSADDGETLPDTAEGGETWLETGESALYGDSGDAYAVEDCGYQEPTYEPAYTGVYVAEYSELYNDNGPTRDMPGWHDGRKETYYSSNVLYHYQTPEWSVDEEGFYRTDEGYYVVGVSAGDYELGDTFEGGKGTCVVMDFGYTTEPTTDYYTAW